MTDGERSATIGNWVKILRAEGHSLPEPIVRSRLEESTAFTDSVRRRLGEVVEEKEYPEFLVRRLLADLLGTLPKAGANGTFEMNGETYGTPFSLAKLLHVSRQTLENRLSKGEIQSTSAMAPNGQLYDYFPLSEVRKICEDLNGAVLLLSDKETVEVDGKTYITVKGFSRLSHISVDAIRDKISKNAVGTQKVRKEKGRVCEAYLLSDLQRVCVGLLEKAERKPKVGDNSQDLPRANVDGFIETEFGVYGTLCACAFRLGLPEEVVEARIATSSLRQLRGKDRSGHITDFYHYPDIRYNCSDLLDFRRSKS